MEVGGDRQAPDMTSSRVVFGSFRFLPFRSLALALAAAVVAPACGGVTLVPLGNPEPIVDDAGTPVPDPSADGGKDAAMGPSCLSTADCAVGETCAWVTSADWCTAFNPAGTCVRPIVSGCQLIEEAIGCGCNRENVTWETGCVGLPHGYAPVGLAHAGPCEGVPTIDAGPPFVIDASEPDAELPFTPDASTFDAGQPVTVDAAVSCTPGEQGPCGAGEECGYPFGACGLPARCLPAEEWGFCDSIESACTCAGTTIAVPGCARAASVPVAFAPGSCGDSDGGF